MSMLQFATSFGARATGATAFFGALFAQEEDPVRKIIWASLWAVGGLVEAFLYFKARNSAGEENG